MPASSVQAGSISDHFVQTATSGMSLIAIASSVSRFEGWIQAEVQWSICIVAIRYELNVGLRASMNGIIRTPLPPNQTFSDDPLRVIRCIRFASRFGFELVSELHISKHAANFFPLVRARTSSYELVQVESAIKANKFTSDIDFTKSWGFNFSSKAKKYKSEKKSPLKLSLMVILVDQSMSTFSLSHLFTFKSQKAKKFMYEMLMCRVVCSRDCLAPWSQSWKEKE